MKNLICTFLLLMGAVFTTQAQLTANLINNVSDKIYLLNIVDNSTPQVSLSVGPVNPLSSVINSTTAVSSNPFKCQVLDVETNAAVQWQISGTGTGSLPFGLKTIYWQCAYSPLVPIGWTIRVSVN